MKKILVALSLFFLATIAHAALTVTQINPSSGIATGGNTVTITGTDLNGVDYVDFGGYNATIVAAGRTNTQMNVIVPNAYTWGAVDVYVSKSSTGDDYNRTSAYTYLAPVINTVTPNQAVLSVVQPSPSAAIILRALPV